MDFREFKKKYQKIEPEEVANFTASEPMVSICVQTYQHADFIKDCLDGILMQETDFPFEILLGEDASTDGTREICKEYAQKYPDKIRLFLHHRENNIKINGQPTGRFNFLYNLYSAKGKYIALCEGDDYWTDPLKLQKQVDFLEKNKAFSLSFHNVHLLFQEKGENSITPMHKNLEKNIFSTEDLLQQWFIPTASIIFRKSRNFEFPEWFFRCASGDIALLLLLSLKGKFKYFTDIMGIYRIHSGGISKTHIGYEKIFSMIYLYQNFDIYSEFRYSSTIKNAMKYEIHTHLPEMKELRRLQKKNRKNKFRGLKLKFKKFFD